MRKSFICCSCKHNVCSTTTTLKKPRRCLTNQMECEWVEYKPEPTILIDNISSELFNLPDSVLESIREQLNIK